MLKDFFKDEKHRQFIWYVLAFIVAILVVWVLVKTTNISSLFSTIENKTFDFRQNVMVNNQEKHPNEDIVIVVTDDASFEYLLNKYGEWPIPRSVYADLINYIEAQSPTVIAFDLIFVNSVKSNINADTQLAKAMNSYDNIITAINLDYQAEDVRKPADLPSKMNVVVKNNSKKVDFSKYLSFTNCRMLLDKLINGSVQIGLVNVIRADDGVLRKLPVFAMYKGNYYPHMSLLMAMNYLRKNEGFKTTEFVIDKDSNLLLGNRKIPIDNEGGAILNWYGHSGKTYRYIPMYKLIIAMENNQQLEDFTFKDKVVLFGTTAVSLHDTKSVPISNVGEPYPGVEIYANYVNNFIDNNFIKKVSDKTNLIITIILAVVVGTLVISASSTLVALGSTALILLTYLLTTYYSMLYFNLWLAVVLPFVAIIAMFIFSYVIKYLIKSQDFEHQYKLATTDGLTELYNHRYFQDQMKSQIDNAQRYGSKFSLIIVDIDFFKKFNDTYGHQAGDAVLKQVAQTLKKSTRSTDIVCRYGGEEMSIILTNTDNTEAFNQAQRICKTVAEKPYKLSATQESHVTISLGVATFPQDGNTPQALIECADNGLYMAKENGRNQVGNLPK